ncbi:MAG TPA: glucose 1-dehydrogenase [Candidatus Binataceae bacterium]|nr:glucose 1-dehydrogenase [Candidatus Binataceae bacterium]
MKQDMYELFDVSGKVALITGASGGFGTTAAKALAAAGAKIMATGRSSAKLEPLVNQIREAGGQAACVSGDPVNHEDVKRVVERTVETFGAIDILIPAAGVNNIRPIVEQPLADWEEVIDVNVKGTWLFCKEAGRHMIAQGRGGKVILVSSPRGELGMSRYTAYSPSKAAINLMAKSLACEWGSHKINVNVVAPTVFRTPMTQWIYDDPAARENFLKRIPMGRLGEPEDFIGALIFLSSRASDFITGVIIYVDGGYTSG